MRHETWRVTLNHAAGRNDRAVPTASRADREPCYSRMMNGALPTGVLNR
jgi:hypothetical protein